MSLMAAGVPLKSPVAGIAMGLITKGDNYTILTDIQGMEDHLGDMDFKVAGTRNGICALQMDIKIKGITKDILKEALEQAKQARFEVLDVMEKQIAKPREEVSKYAPKTMTFMINPNRIKEVIGKGGEMITKIICEASNVTAVTDINAVKVDHLNDSLYGLSSHKDRHAKIGEGKIGLPTFERIINHPALRHLPFYLETPNELPGYQAEIELLRSLYKE